MSEALSQMLAPMRAVYMTSDVGEGCPSVPNAAWRLREAREWEARQRLYATLSSANRMCGSLKAEAGRLRVLHTERRNEAWDAYFPWYDAGR